MSPNGPIAIVGMGCQFPQAPDLATYWHNIRTAKVCFSDVPADRWNHALYYHPSAREIDKSYARKCGFIEDVRSFAALHYGLSPLRVKVMDPQHRLLIESVRMALSDAGYEARTFDRESTGVFIGASVSEHKDLVTSRLRAQAILDGQFGRTPELPPEHRAAVVEDIAPVRAFSIAGNLLNMMAATVAQVFDLGGPAFTLDAACSSALVAVYEAILHLRAGQCDAALAGGVYLNLTPDNMVGFSRIGAISKTDACRPFDAASDGFVLGEGVGVVMLKRLEDAVRDGDRIYAVVRGAGINNDGRGEGPMTPRQGGQLSALNRAYNECGISTDTVGYVEAHGTGTGVGDVVEVGALKECYGARRQGPVNAVLSSVKANIGHTMSAAGVAGLIKAALVVHEQTIPPQAAFSTQHPALDLAFGDGGFRIARQEERWEKPEGHARRAAVSSFGFGGTNCHLVLEEAPNRDALAAEVRAEPFVISAPTTALLEKHLSTLRTAITENEAGRASLAELAFTLSTRLREAACVAFAATTREELLQKLDEARAIVADTAPKSRAGIRFSAAPLEDDARRLAFLFPGQGAQSVGLCEQLYRRFPQFRARLQELLGPKLLAHLYPEAPFDLAAANAALTQTEICQPIMAALGIALAEWAESLGLRPVAMVGHSLGEFAALAAGGVLDPVATVRFVEERGRLMAQLDGDHGAMAAVGADRATVERYAAAQPGVVAANVNAPQQVVVSGTTAGVEALVARLAADGVSATPLQVSHAFHSPLVAPSAAGIAERVAALEIHPAKVPVVSCIEPGVYPAEPAAARSIMARHATAPVDFVAGVQRCAALGAKAFVQVGAGGALLSMTRSTLAAQSERPIALVSLASMEPDDGRRLIESLGELASLGVPVDFAALYAGEAVSVVSLPATPLMMEKYWIAQREARPPLPPLVAPSEATVQPKPPASSNASDALVALFREQMSVLRQQNEIIQRQTAALSGAGVEIPAALLIAAPVIAAPQPAPIVAAAAPPVAAKPAEAPRPPAPAVPDAAIASQVFDVVSRVSAFPRAAVKPEQRLIGELGFDSLMAVELSAKLTEAFPGLGGLPRSIFVDSTTVQEVVDYVVSKTNPTATASTPVQTDGAVRRFVPSWAARPAGKLPEGAEAPFIGPTLILADGLGVAPLLAVRLAQAGRPAAIGGPEALLAHAPPRTIIDLRALVPSSGTPTAEQLRAPVEAAFHLARAASRGTLPSCFALAFSGDKAAGLSGFAKALAREWPDACVKAIEVNGTAEAMADALATELLSGETQTEVRYQAGRREVVELADASVGNGPALRDRAVVAISGGGAGLGAKLALDLARRSHARLVLLGRSAASDVTRSLQAEVARAGGEAIYLSCDVTNETSTSAALADARRQLGPIEYVVHAAGFIADAPVGRKRDEDFSRVFDTKVAGALSLWRATASDPVRRFVIYTSWAGRFGNASQTDYSAANHLIARLATTLAAERPNVRVTALDLPPWDGSAMVRTIPDAVRAMMRADGVPFLSDAEGLDLVVRELTSDAPSGEVLFARSAPAGESGAEASFKLTLETHPYLDDHRIDGRPVVPLAAAMDYALASARSVSDSGAFVSIGGFDLIDGVALSGDEVWIHTRARRRGAEITVELKTSSTIDGARTLAYRGHASAVNGALPTVAEPAIREKPTMPVADFYARHTFHGPLMRGIAAVDDVGPSHVAGRVRSAHNGELSKSAFTVDPLLIDSSFQLAAYWAFTRHGRGGFPLGFAEYRALAPIAPGAEIHCLLTLERSKGDLFIGHIDYRDANGTLVAQLRGMKAQLREVAQVEAGPAVDPSYYKVEEFPEYLDLRQRLEMAEASGVSNPYFRVHERVTNDTSLLEGREVINFSSYNYVGLSGDPDVNRAVAEAAERYGTSASASRVASGEKPIHRELEAELANFLGCEDSIVMVGGHATNVSVIATLCRPGDLIMHDALAHDSIMGGAKLSGASRRAFPHNDWKALDETLTLIRPNFKRVLIAIEGTYSMDGDLPPLDRIIEIKKKHHALLLVDEAHSLGVLGATGRGIGEHFGVNPADVELWMGTMSKSLASCGGYIAGSHAMVEFLKYNVGGFVFSVGMSPPNAASALAALRKLEAHPELVTRLHERSRFFLDLCRERGINTGMSDGSAVVPCIVGNSWDCLQLSQALGNRGINVQPILYPAVEDKLSRLRFFITSRHSEAQLRTTADALAEELEKLGPDYLKPPASSVAAPPPQLNGAATRPTV